MEKIFREVYTLSGDVSKPENVEGVLQELSPKGLFIYVYDLFEDEATADNFIKMVEKWSCRR